MAEDLEIYAEFEEQDSMYIENLDDKYTGRKSVPMVASNSNELKNWT